MISAASQPRESSTYNPLSGPQKVGYVKGDTRIISPNSYMSSSRTDNDTSKRNRERISIQSLTSQPDTTPSSSSSTLFNDPRDIPRPLSRSGRRASKSYRLTIIQQPTIGAAHGAYYLSRLPLAPALIVRLSVIDASGRPIPADDELPFFVATIRLIDENGHPIRDPPDEPSHASAQQKRLLYGSLVSSPYTLFDLSGQKGTFFLFPDVSVRLEGKYRLGISITRLRDHEMTLINSGIVTPLAQELTDVFSVVSQNEYVAPSTSQLSKHFQLQGAPKT